MPIGRGARAPARQSSRRRRRGGSAACAAVPSTAVTSPDMGEASQNGGAMSAAPSASSDPDDASRRPGSQTRPMLAADYPFLNILWTMIIFFTWVMWIWMMVYLFTDLFRRADIGGWGKAAWCVFMIVLPFLGALIYLIAQHDGIAQRNLERMQAAEQAFDQRVQAAAVAQGNGGGGGGAAGEIERASKL